MNNTLLSTKKQSTKTIKEHLLTAKIKTKMIIQGNYD
jgi:hypothetical protein